MKKYLFLITLSFLVEACHTHSFLPPTQNTPLFTNKEQAIFSGAITYRSLEINGAYTPIKHFAVMGSLQVSNAVVPELGIGTYSSIYKNKIVGEIYGGIALCNLYYKKEDEKIKSIIGSPNGHYNFDITMKGYRVFLQPNLGFRISDKINIAMSTKACLWYFTQYEYYRETWDYLNASGSHSKLADKDSTYLKNVGAVTIEPAITLKTGGKYGKFMVQTGVNLNITNNEKLPVPYHNIGMFIRLGFNVAVDFNDFKKKKSSTNQNLN
ncbi:MAG: hypothetical protein JNL69_03885 [Bacteroidia bacterium]|nr:hypothetical protein [Bacteroidia bacterium]